MTQNISDKQDIVFHTLTNFRVSVEVKGEVSGGKWRLSSVRDIDDNDIIPFLDIQELNRFEDEAFEECQGDDSYEAE